MFMYIYLYNMSVLMPERWDDMLYIHVYRFRSLFRIFMYKMYVSNLIPTHFHKERSIQVSDGDTVMVYQRLLTRTSLAPYALG